MPDEYVIIEKSSLNSIGDTVRSATGSTDSIAVSALSSEVASAVANSGTGLPSGGAPYQQLVTDEDGNTKWVAVNTVIYRDSYGNLSVDQCIEFDGYPASIDYMMLYGSILLIDDVSGVISPCISAFNSGSGYYILTFMLIDESSTIPIKIKVAEGKVVDGKISIIES